MDVRISHGIKLNKVPNKISTMLEEMDMMEIERLIEMASQLLEMSDTNSEMAEKLIEQAREKIASLDRNLSDMSMILKGYINAQKPPEQQEEQGEVTNAD